MEGNMNNMARDPFENHRDGDLRQLMKTLKELQEMVDNAQMQWGTGRCKVDKKVLMDYVDLIARLLPDSLKQASKIISDEQSIRENARRESSEQTEKARAEAQKTIDEATLEAEKTRAESKRAAEEAARANVNAKNAASSLKVQAEKEAENIRSEAQRNANYLCEQAQQKADAIVESARNEARMIIADAENRARVEASKEKVYQMAVVQANDLREETEKDMAAMRQHYMRAMYNMMGSVDEYLVSLVNSIRNERQELINKQ